MVFRRKRKALKHHGKYKYCPVCGKQLERHDSYCISCGYSFSARDKKVKKLKLRNIIIVLIILVGAYLGVRYTNGQPLIPTSLQDAISTFLPQ